MKTKPTPSKSSYALHKKIFWWIFIIAFVKSVFFAHFGFGLLDEGESLHNATRILAGELPYRDFFAIFPPLDNYFFALIFSLFGKSVIAPRLVMSIIFAFAPAFMFLILTKYVKTVVAVVPVFLLVFLDLNVERLYFFTPIFVAIYLINKNIFISGLLLGLASLIRADIPGTYLAGLGLALLIGSLYNHEKFGLIFKKLVVFGLGYLIPVLTVTYWMYANNILALFIKSAILDSVIITKLHDLPFPSILHIIPSTLSLSAFAASYEATYTYLMLAVYIVFFCFLMVNWREVVKKDISIVGLFFAGVLALPYVFGRSDMGHIVKGSMPFLFLAAYLFTKLRTKYLTFFATCVVLMLFLAGIVQSIWWIRFNNTTVSIGGYSLRINSSYSPGSTAVTADTLEKSVEFLKHSEQGEKVLALPYMAGIYFLADRQPPIKFYNLLAGFITSAEEENEFISQVRQLKIKRLIYTPETGPRMEKNKLRDYNPLIHEFIMANYKPVAETKEGWLLMELK